MAPFSAVAAKHSLGQVLAFTKRKVDHPLNLVNKLKLDSKFDFISSLAVMTLAFIDNCAHLPNIFEYGAGFSAHEGSKSVCLQNF